MVILNGGWDCPSPNEGADASRRLFYVAMTRARRSLAVLAEGPHPFLQSKGDEALQRTLLVDDGALPHGQLRYQSGDPKLVDLSFAGRLMADNPSLAATAAAQVGDPVALKNTHDGWLILNAMGVVIGRMARAFTPPIGAKFHYGEITAILRWRKSDNEESYHFKLQRAEWEVILPELVFEQN